MKRSLEKDHPRRATDRNNIDRIVRGLEPRAPAHRLGTPPRSTRKRLSFDDVEQGGSAGSSALAQS
jgi:hypothetical protein